MLQLKNIHKIYRTRFSEQIALKNINLTFKEGEFVSVLGPSGCGKTTLLNLIGGLDRYTSGDLIVNGKSTKNFTQSDWDAYRNHSVGFVFQSYNLIQHISILDNVELGMTLSGVSAQERREKALFVLKRVGLTEHIHKHPYQLSGGQKQRVAIARALVNNPDVILADEPTGALDTTTSAEVLDLIKEIASEKLVIMVTHNRELAEKYSNRIVRLVDGEVIEDSKPSHSTMSQDEYKPNKTSMSFLTALKLSFNNLRTKKVRTLITALAGSIGIIGISLVLSISNGFNSSINDLQSSTFSSFPLQINHYTYVNIGGRFGNTTPSKSEVGNELYAYDPLKTDRHENIFSDDYLNYLNQMDSNFYSSLEYNYGVRQFLVMNTESGAQPVSQNAIGWSTLYRDDTFTLTQYDLLSGHLPDDNNQVVLVVDQSNQVEVDLLATFGFNADTDTVQYTDFIGKTFRMAQNNDIYVYNTDSGKYSVTTDYTDAYNHGTPLTVVGILRGKANGLQASNRGIYYKSNLVTELLTTTQSSKICIDQEATDELILAGVNTGTTTKDDVLLNLGCTSTPTSVLIYPKTSDTKDQIKAYLDAYNTNKSNANQILYRDISETITSTLGTIVNMVSNVLVAFAAISLIVSSIMIGIITYVSVLERTKEIGILRSLGARMKDISRVFNAETVIVGFVAGTLGILITYLLSFPLNLILTHYVSELKNVVQMSFLQSLFLIVISIVLTFISGLIPSRIAAKKDPVEALRQNE